MEMMNFLVWPGERRRHSRSYDNDEQQRQAGKDTFSCFFISELPYQGQLNRENGTNGIF